MATTKMKMVRIQNTGKASRGKFLVSVAASLVSARRLCSSGVWDDNDGDGERVKRTKSSDLY